VILSNLDGKDMPKSFKDLPSQEGMDYIFSQRVLDPRLKIIPTDEGYEAILYGVRKTREEEFIYRAPSRSHNWVIDGNILRPLPTDTTSSLERVFKHYDLSNLNFPDLLAIARIDQDEFELEYDQDVFAPASKSAEKYKDSEEIPGLKASLFPYQLAGVRWMQQILNRTGGLILADEMGLGKTMQILALFLLTPPKNSSPALIICPTTLIANWRREILTFCPQLTVLMHGGPYRTGVISGLQRAQIVITTYDTAINDLSLLTAMEWSWLICDEAQAIKNPDSARRKALAEIPRSRTIPMTGTPVENSLLDLWSIADFAIPGLLGSRKQFEAQYSDDTDSALALSEITGPIVLRRTVADVAGDLPDRTDIDLPIELSNDLAMKYEQIRKETMEEYLDAGALVATIRLQVFCAHPLLHYHKTDSEFWYEDARFEEEYANTLDTPKVEMTVSLIKEAFSNNRKVLIFSNFNRCGDLIKNQLNHDGDFFWESINGITPQEDRLEIVDQFSHYDGNACMVLNPRAAGSGLNITAATVVIHYTQVWNPALEAQASARAHRRGQKNPVTIYRLYYEGTVEEVMIERSRWKRDLGNDAVPISSREKSDLRRALEITPEQKNE